MITQHHVVIMMTLTFKPLELLRSIIQVEYRHADGLVFRAVPNTTKYSDSKDIYERMLRIDM